MKNLIFIGSIVLLFFSCSSKLLPNYSFSYFPEVAFVNLENVIIFDSENYYLEVTNGRIEKGAGNTYILTPESNGQGEILMKSKRGKIVKKSIYRVLSPPKPTLKLIDVSPDHFTKTEVNKHLIASISIDLIDGNSLLFNYPVTVERYEVNFYNGDEIVQTLPNKGSRLNNDCYDFLENNDSIDKITFTNIKMKYEGGIEYTEKEMLVDINSFQSEQ